MGKKQFLKWGNVRQNLTDVPIENKKNYKIWYKIHVLWQECYFVTYGN